MRILVTGISGYVGATLAPRLVADGHEVRGMSRRGAGRVAGIEAVRADALSGEGLETALEGIEVAYYLIHSMEPSADGGFEIRERRAAERFVAGARAAGVRRIVYLGGLVPSDGVPSLHLSSRLGVEQVLLESMPESVAFRASIVIGARSRSFRFMVRLVERLPVLALPAWHPNRTQPIDERDVIEYLARTPGVEPAAARSLDIVGPDVLSYGEMIDRIAELMGVGRMPLGFKRSLTSPASAVVSAVTEEPIELVRPLMQSLESDMLPSDPEEAARLYGIHPRRFDRAVEHALAEWEAAEPLGAR
jgi:uncharacterized protein YbjT (DUF2867 family)